MLHAFVCGFSRLSPRSESDILGNVLKRRDAFQTLYLLALKGRAPLGATEFLNRASNRHLDRSSFRFAIESDVFLYYRTTGRHTNLRLKKEQAKTVCVLEEVNSHVEQCLALMQREYEALGLGSYHERFPDMDARLEAYAEADYILCPSEWVKRSFIEKGFAPEKILKNPYGMSLAPAGAVDRAASETFRILFVGQVHFRKGLRHLFEAFRKLSHPKKELVIVGPNTPITGLEKTALPAGVTFAGELKGEALQNAYRTADVFCLPSVEEGLALVMGEALAFGLPVIATSHTGAEDLFTDGKEGLIVAPFSSIALTDALQRLADDRGLRETMSAAARDRAASLGGWNSSVRNLADLLARVSTITE